jgi:hypothetical protein
MNRDSLQLAFADLVSNGESSFLAAMDPTGEHALQKYIAPPQITIPLLCIKRLSRAGTATWCKGKRCSLFLRPLVHDDDVATVGTPSAYKCSSSSCARAEALLPMDHHQAPLQDLLVEMHRYRRL